MTTNFNRCCNGIAMSWRYRFNDPNKKIYKLAYNSEIIVNVCIVKVGKDKYKWETLPLSIETLKKIEANQDKKYYMSSHVDRLNYLPLINKKSFNRLLKNELITSDDSIIYRYNPSNKFSNRIDPITLQRINKPEPIKQDSRYKSYKRKMEKRKNWHWTKRLTDKEIEFMREFHNMEDAGTAKAITGHPSRGKFTLKKKKLNKKYRRSVVKHAKPND